ncbi:hypothetical protein QFZ67_000079 [Streptomyces sp. V1I1]|nr:hypothetical protein [Streptomyces sp. V1I1]
MGPGERAVHALPSPGTRAGRQRQHSVKSNVNALARAMSHSRTGPGTPHRRSTIRHISRRPHVASVHDPWHAIDNRSCPSAAPTGPRRRDHIRRRGPRGGLDPLRRGSRHRLRAHPARVHRRRRGRRPGPHQRPPAGVLGDAGPGHDEPVDRCCHLRPGSVSRHRAGRPVRVARHLPQRHPSVPGLGGGNGPDDEVCGGTATARRDHRPRGLRRQRRDDRAGRPELHLPPCRPARQRGRHLRGSSAGQDARQAGRHGRKRLGRSRRAGRRPARRGRAPRASGGRFPPSAPGPCRPSAHWPSGCASRS